ncbi:MAG: hypothetical protein QM767_18530 [Anaeromyxobacter sp.]
MSEASQHVAETNNPNHVSVSGSTEGGACLFHNEPKHKQNSCSCRWQARQEKREAHTKVYKNYPVADDRAGLAARGIAGDRLATMQREAKSGGLTPLDRDYAATLALPGAGDWDLDGPTVARPSPAATPPRLKRQIPVGQNFRTAFWP